MKISAEELKDFDSIDTKRKLMEKYGDVNDVFTGKNEDGESVELHISKTSIILKTSQSNGWVRVNEFDEDGYACGESFDGKWNCGEFMER